MSYVDPTNGYGGPNTYGSPGASTTGANGLTIKPISAQVTPTGTDTSGGSSGSMSANDWAQWLGLINGIANSQKKPTFVQPPWAPKQEGLFDYGMQRVMSLPHTGEALAPYAMARASENNPIDINALKAGRVGYTPTGGANQADLVKNMGLGNPNGSAPPPSTPGGDSPGSSPSGSGPGGLTNDPFAGWNTGGASGNADLGSLFRSGIDYINSHGGVSGKNAGLTSGAIAAYLGVPGLLATGLGKIIGMLWDRYAGGDRSINVDQIAKIVANANQAGGIAGLGPKESDPNDPSTWMQGAHPIPSSSVSYSNQDTTATGDPLASGVPQEAMNWSPLNGPRTRGNGRQAV